MGLKGSYVNYGAGWATASGTPLTLYKGSASEGGMRVPFFVYYPQRLQMGVDNILTSSPDVLVDLLREREEMSNAEQTLLFVSDFLAGRL